MTQQPTPSSSATTAKEIQSHLTSLRKSRQSRSRLHKQLASDSSRDAERELDRNDALTFDKLRRVFGRLIDEVEFSVDKKQRGDGVEDETCASAKWSAWLTSQHEAFVTLLMEHVENDKVYALRTFCGVIANCPSCISSGGKTEVADGDKISAPSKKNVINDRLLTKLLESVLKSNTKSSHAKDPSTEEAMVALLDGEFIKPYRDVQYFVLIALQRLSERLLGGSEKETKKKKPSKKNKKKGKSREEKDGDSELEQDVEMVAENMCRLLLKMDYIAKSQSDLMEDTSFLFAPPALGGEGENDKEEDELNHEDEEIAEEDSEDSDSDSSDDDNNQQDKNQNGKRPSSSDPANNNRFTKRSKKNKQLSWQQSYKHRFAFQEAWLAVLRLQMPSRTTKVVLQHLSTYVLGIVPTPLRFAEYFTRSFRDGTVTSSSSGTGKGGTATSTNNNSNNSLIAILSLHGLFILILNHQLEYPQFYPSLYKLLHPRILYTKHRTRFLRLLSKSLESNSMLPAYVVAAFCKKLLRLGLSGPPSGALFVLALVSNLIRKHGEVGCLIHRTGSEEGGWMEDVFVEDAEDLMQTRALESSLWELIALQKHYHPAVSALAACCGTEDDKTPMYDMEDFMVHTYKSLFEQEKKRIVGGGMEGKVMDGGGKKKTRVSLTFVEPKGLFCEGDVFGGAFKSS